MKNALVLHGTNGKPTANWFPWIKKQLEKKGYIVWVPQLPHAEKPNSQRYNAFLFSNKDFVFNKETILIGHSSGAVALLGLLQELSENTSVDTCILIGSFINNLGREDLKELFVKPFDFEKIKTHAKKFIVIHSDDDPYCPLDHAKYLTEQLGGELHVLKGQKHFNIETAGKKYNRFPEILELM